MKIRSLLLGSAAIAGLATTGYAADLGVVTSLDVCDELGLSGLTISSDDNCLVISGKVNFEYKLGNYTSPLGDHVYAAFGDDNVSNLYTQVDDFGFADHSADVDSWLKFVATSNTDFGPATATIKLIQENQDGAHSPTDFSLGLDEAWVGVGDTTKLMAGYVHNSIFNYGDDATLNYLGLFNNEHQNKDGYYWRTTGADLKNDAIQVTSDLGNGILVGGALEDVGDANTAVGVISYAGDGVTAHLSGAIDPSGAWKMHAGFTGAWDPIKVVAFVAADDTGYWTTMGSVAATFDMFTLAASAEATSESEWGVGGSLSANVTDTVTLNLGGRYFHGHSYQDQAGTFAPFVPGQIITGPAYDTYQVEAGISSKVTETVALTGAVGVTDTTGPAVPGNLYTTNPLAFYGKAGATWTPGVGFSVASNVTVTSLGGYQWDFVSSKTF